MLFIMQNKKILKIFFTESNHSDFFCNWPFICREQHLNEQIQGTISIFCHFILVRVLIFIYLLIFIRACAKEWGDELC